MEHLTTILQSLFTLLATLGGAWFVYNQHTKNKMTELKIEKMKEDNENKRLMDTRNTAICFGELWSLLYRLNSDRCFIIQPHPIDKHSFLSVVFEVDRKGISAVKEIFQNIPISDMAQFAKLLATNIWLYFDDVEKQVNDKKAQSMMALSGSTQICIRQLVNAKNSWIGNLVVENIDLKDIAKQEAMDIITNTATTIQFILPPIS